MPPDRIIYRGVPMIEGWPAKIEAAQRIPILTYGTQVFPRVRYGDEQDDWGADKHSCHDCRVIKGEFHVPGCDAERCPVCGGQLLGCDCSFDELPSGA
jgi:hypothetical protein